MQKKIMMMVTVLVVALVATTLGHIAPVSATGNGGDKVTICHRTSSESNPYVKITVAQSAVDGDLGNDRGRGDHFAKHTGPIFKPGMKNQGIKWGDIIPSISGIHDGLNWTAEGRAILENGCEPTPPPPTTTTTTTTVPPTTTTTTVPQTTTTTTTVPPTTTTPPPDEEPEPEPVTTPTGVGLIVCEFINGAEVFTLTYDITDPDNTFVSISHNEGVIENGDVVVIIVYDEDGEQKESPFTVGRAKSCKPPTIVQTDTPSIGDEGMDEGTFVFPKLGIMKELVNYAVPEDGVFSPVGDSVAAWGGFTSACDEGTTLIGGHMTNVFAELGTLEVSDRFFIVCGDEIRHYEVSSVELILKTAVDWTPLMESGGLALVTCGGIDEDGDGHTEWNILVQTMEARGPTMM